MAQGLLVKVGTTGRGVHYVHARKGDTKRDKGDIRRHDRQRGQKGDKRAIRPHKSQKDEENQQQCNQEDNQEDLEEKQEEVTTELRPYPEFIDSGVPWPSRFSVHRDVRRNGHLAAQRNETGLSRVYRRWAEAAVPI